MSDHRIRVPWSERYDQYVQWVTEHGAHPISTGGADELLLATWASTQRQHWRMNSGDRVTRAARTAAMEAIPGWTWKIQRRPARIRGKRVHKSIIGPTATGNDLRWIRKYRFVNDFVGRTGRLPRYDSPFKAERAASAWLSRQRGEYLDRTILIWRAELLGAVPGWEWELTHVRGKARHPRIWAQPATV